VVDLASLFKRRVLPLGARVRVLVTAPESVGRLAAFRITEKGADGALPRCLLPGGQATAC
jgi:hypothetical protein